MKGTPIEDIDLNKVFLEIEDLRPSIKEATDEPKLITCNFKDDNGKPLRVQIEGEMTTRGITAKKTDFGTKHTLGLDVPSDAMEIMNELVEMVQKLRGIDHEWDVKEIFFKGKWYPQIKVDKECKSRYDCVTLPRQYPGKQSEDLVKGTRVIIDTQIGAWFNIKKDAMRAGVFFTFVKVSFIIDEEEKPEPPVAAPFRKRVKT